MSDRLPQNQVVTPGGDELRFRSRVFVNSPFRVLQKDRSRDEPTFDPGKGGKAKSCRNHMAVDVCEKFERLRRQAMLFARLNLKLIKISNRLLLTADFNIYTVV